MWAHQQPGSPARDLEGRGRGVAGDALEDGFRGASHHGVEITVDTFPFHGYPFLPCARPYLTRPGQPPIVILSSTPWSLSLTMNICPS